MDRCKAGGYVAGRTLAVRMAGLPVSLLEDLRFEDTWKRVHERLDYDAWLSAEGSALSEVLHSIIGQPRVADVKPQLVALRRTIFNGRQPGRHIWPEPVRHALPTEVADRIRNWAGRLAARDTCAAELPEILRNEATVKRELLRAAVSRDNFRNGLLHSSPVLFDELAKWLRGHTGTAPDQQLLLRLAKYLSRVAAKTSPYSTFALSGLGVLDLDADDATRSAGVPDSHRVVELNAGIVQRIARAIARHPEIARQLTVRVNPSAVRVGTRVEFLGAPPEEPIISLALTDTLRACLAHVEATSDCTMEMLRRRLGAAAGSGQDDERVGHYADLLITTGLLQPQVPFTHQGGDPLREIISWLEPAQDAGLRRLRNDLLGLQEGLQAYSDVTSPDDRRARHRKIHRAVADLLSALDPGSPKAVAQKNLFHESAIFTQPLPHVGGKQWRPVMDDLDAIRRFIALFSRDLPFRLAAAEFFAARYRPGEEVGLMSFYRTASAAIRGDDETPQGAELRELWGATALDRPTRDSPSASVRELARLRSHARQAVLGLPVDANGTVVVNPALLRDIVGSWPLCVEPLGSICCYLQAVMRDGTSHLVINGINIGYGRGINRVRYLAARAGGTHLSHDGGSREPACRALLAESQGMFGTNLNLRARALRYEIEYPFTVSGRSQSERIPLNDLYVMLDSGTSTLRLISRQLNREVCPVHLGLMADFWLPTALQFMIKVFGEPSTPVHPSRPFLVDMEAAEPPAGLRHFPRVDVGRVTIARSSWLMRAREAPRRQKGESDAEYLVRLVAWLQRHQIPDRCFVRVIGPRAVSRFAAPKKSWKPTYIDFANWYLAAVFERLVSNPEDTIVIQEALPALADAVNYGSVGNRVTEYIVEISGTETGHG